MLGGRARARCAQLGSRLPGSGEATTRLRSPRSRARRALRAASRRGTRQGRGLADSPRPRRAVWEIARPPSMIDRRAADARACGRRRPPKTTASIIDGSARCEQAQADDPSSPRKSRAPATIESRAPSLKLTAVDDHAPGLEQPPALVRARLRASAARGARLPEVRASGPAPCRAAAPISSGLNPIVADTSAPASGEPGSPCNRDELRLVARASERPTQRSARVGRPAAGTCRPEASRRRYDTVVHDRADGIASTASAGPLDLACAAQRAMLPVSRPRQEVDQLLGRHVTRLGHPRVSRGPRHRQASSL